MENSHSELQLARAYVKIQHFEQRWDPMKGLLNGTIFPELNRPYQPKYKAELADDYQGNDYSQNDSSGTGWNESPAVYVPRHRRKQTGRQTPGPMKGGKKSGK
jgi:hypothetical protein